MRLQGFQGYTAALDFVLPNGDIKRYDRETCGEEEMASVAVCTRSPAPYCLCRKLSLHRLSRANSALMASKPMAIGWVGLSRTCIVSLCRHLPKLRHYTAVLPHARRRISRKLSRNGEATSCFLLDIRWCLSLAVDKFVAVCRWCVGSFSIFILFAVFAGGCPRLCVDIRKLWRRRCRVDVPARQN